MRKSLQIITLLKNISTGVTASVLTMVLLTHGATLQNVSLLLGAYSATVIAAEFPTGVFADRFGRKTAFVIAMGFLLASFCVLLTARDMPALILTMILQGLGRAFSSGSLDALAIDEAPDETGVIHVTARLSMLESAGLALGALAGGGLAGIGTRYAANILVNLGLSAILLCLALFAVREEKPAARLPRAVANPSARAPVSACGDATPRTPNAPGEAAAVAQAAGLGAHLRESLSFVFQSGLTRMLFSFAALSGFAMFTVETYWQPALSALAAAPWMLGIVSFLGFGSVMAGTRLTERATSRNPARSIGLLLAQKALYGACLLLLALAAGVGAFIGAYMLAYLFLGGSSVVESALLNREAPSSRRASILSLFSLLLQLGGLCASAIGYVVSSQVDFRAMWVLGGGLLLLAVGLWALAGRRGRAAQ